MTIQAWHPLDNVPKLKSATEPTLAQMEQRRKRALLLCENALNDSSYQLANKLALAWLGCGCAALGVMPPKAEVTQ